MRQNIKHSTMPLSLPGGWSVRIPCQENHTIDTQFTQRPLPSVETWTVFLNTLIQDTSRLAGYHTIKRNNKAEVFRATLTWENNSLEVACKIRDVVGTAKRIRTRLGWGAEARQFRMAQYLIARYIPTAQPLAYGWCMGSTARTLLITEYINDAIDLDQLALVELPKRTPSEAHHIKRALTESLAVLTSHIQESGVSHRDFKGSNILISSLSNINNLQCWLVDLEGVSVHHRPITGAKQWTPIIRLAASLAEYSSITNSDYAKFLQKYLTCNKKDARQWKTLLIELADKVTLYNRRAKARKNHKLDGYAG